MSSENPAVVLDIDNRLELSLSGGKSIRALAVRLYPTQTIADWRQMISDAEAQLAAHPVVLVSSRTQLGWLARPSPWV